MADDTVGNRLRDRRCVRRRHRRYAHLDAGASFRGADQTLARLVDQRRRLVLNARRARVPGPLRAAIPGRRSLYGRHLHGRARHPERYAGSLRGAGRRRRLLATAVPAIACYLIVAVVRWYVGDFIVAPNQLVRERPFIAHNIEMTRRAYALERIETHAFPADTGIEAVEQANNQTTLENIRLWDWRALQDTLRQIQ